MGIASGLWRYLRSQDGANHDACSSLQFGQLAFLLVVAAIEVGSLTLTGNRRCWDVSTARDVEQRDRLPDAEVPQIELRDVVVLLVVGHGFERVVVQV